MKKIEDNKPDQVSVRLTYIQRREVNKRLDKLELNISEYIRLLLLLDTKFQVFETLNITQSSFNKKVDRILNLKAKAKK